MQRAAAGTSSRSGSSKSRTRRKSRRKRKTKTLHQQTKHEEVSTAADPPADNPENPGGLELWKETYDNIVRWQTKHQTSYWRNAAEQLRLENAELKRQLVKIERNGKPETSSDSDSDEVPVDEKYLKFMEITQQHRADLKLKKEQEESGS